MELKFNNLLNHNPWLTSTNHKKNPNYYVQSGLAIIPQNYNYEDEAVNISTTKGGNDVV